MKKKQPEQAERRSSPWREIVDVVYAGLAEDPGRQRADHEAPTVDNGPRPINAATR